MMGLLHSCGKAFQFGRSCLVTAVLIGGLSGCAGWSLHDEGFPENDLSKTVRKARSPKEEKKVDYWSFSEKGQQIERDLGPL
jgi:hypothetical protein